MKQNLRRRRIRVKRLRLHFMRVTTRGIKPAENAFGAASSRRRLIEREFAIGIHRISAIASATTTTRISKGF